MMNIVSGSSHAIFSMLIVSGLFVMLIGQFVEELRISVKVMNFPYCYEAFLN